jgi:serine/threonine protein kinase
MALSAGTRLGPYEIVSPLGAGGMGEVYRARDTRLDRRVAIKVLPAHLSTNADLRARFDREAKAISALQHAHICVLYDVGKEAEVDFLVMEYLEGETLAARLARKPLALEETLCIAIEVAEALDTAHRHGVIHRDLKPGNIMLTKSGSKLMDFGLAKPHGLAASGSMPAFSAVATMTSPASPITTAGTVVGTVQYMSPEQIQGQEADARSDLFALGATLYEMLAGKRAFAGKSQLSVASAILEKDPEPLSTLQPLTPPALERVVRKCLAKDPEERWQNTRDLATELRWIAEGRTQPVTPGVARGPKRELLYGALIVAVLFAIVSAVSYWRLARVPSRAIIAEIPPPDKTRFSFFGSAGGPPALSPNGHALAFGALDENGKSMLWVRSLDSPTARPLPGTEGAADPFWSPDSEVLAFFADGKLKTIGISGGPATVVAAAPADGGGSWERDGTILFAPDYTKGLYKVAAGGGTPSVVVAPDAPKITYCAFPKFLPDGKHFLYLAGSGDPAIGGTYYASLDGNEKRLLVRGDTAGIYASGFLLYLREGALIAQPFDPAQGQQKGPSHSVVEQVATGGAMGMFDASENGILIYLTGSLASTKRLTWFDRAGKNLGATGEPADYFDLRISPDGRMLAANAGYPAGSPNSEIWVEELARAVRMRLTIDPDTDHGIPVWSPDGRRIAFGALQGKARVGIYQKPSNGGGDEELILASENSNVQIWPTSWSQDGKFILFTQGNVSLAQADIWVLVVGGKQKPRLFLKAPAPAYDGQFAPDGRWVAYTSRESGRDEVYVVPFDAAKVLNPVSGVAGASGGK